MANLLVLLSGELQRMRKYNIFTGGLAVSLLWVSALYFLRLEFVEGLFTTLLFIDVTSMPAILVAVSLFYEKQEGSLHAMLVSPIGHGEYIGAKVLGTAISSWLTLIILYLYAHFGRGMEANFPLLVVAAGLASVFHTLLGFLLTYGARDFTGMLMRYMGYALIFMGPTLLDHIGVVNSSLLHVVLFMVPPRAVSILFDAAVLEAALWEILYSVLFLTIASAGLYRFVLRGFVPFVEKEGGV